jgi:hypothetical protein
LAAWHRRQAEDTTRTLAIRLPLDLARRLRAEASARGVPAGRYVGDLLRVALGDLPTGPPPAPALPSIAGGPVTPPQAPPAPADPGRVSLRALRLIQLREGRDGEFRQIDTADRAVVRRILEADLAWLRDIDRRAARGVVHDTQ